MTPTEEKPQKPDLRSVKLLKDKTGVSRQYQIALDNPTIATVAALQEVWTRTVEEWITKIEKAREEEKKRLAERDDKIRKAVSVLGDFCRLGDMESVSVAIAIIDTALTASKQDSEGTG